MSKVNVNDVALSVADEPGFGEDPTSGALAHIMEPNEISNFGGSIETVARSPLGDRQRRKGTITSFEAAAEFTTDLTIGHLRRFAPGFALQEDWEGHGKIIRGVAITGTGTTAKYVLPVGWSTGTPADSTEYPWNLQNALIKVSGFTNDSSNGLKHITSGISASRELTVGGAALVSESANSQHTIQIVGFRGGSGKIKWTGDGTLKFSTSTDAPNQAGWSNLGLTIGTWIYIGGDQDDNKFTSSLANGWFKVSGFTGTKNSTLILHDPFKVVENGDNKSLDIYFGQRVHNVSPAESFERYYRFEAQYKGLVGSDGRGTGFEYVLGAAPNQWTISLPLTEKATCTYQFAAKQAKRIEISRDAGFPTPPQILDGQTAFNTSVDFSRLRLSDGSVAEDVFFKNLEIVLNNNYSPEQVLAQAGAAFMNLGALEVTATSNMLFTDKAFVDAIYDNTTFSLTSFVGNEDGAAIFELPSVTLGGGAKEFPANETVKISLEATSFRDEHFGDSINISMFGYLPKSALLDK